MRRGDSHENTHHLIILLASDLNIDRVVEIVDAAAAVSVAAAVTATESRRCARAADGDNSRD